LRLALAALDRLAKWDQTIGVVPTTQLAWVLDELSIRRFLDALRENLEANGIPADTVEEIIEDTEERSPPFEPPVE
jgi:hypothetical protein